MKRRYTDNQTRALIGSIREKRRDIDRLEKMLLDEYDRLEERIMDLEELSNEGRKLTEKQAAELKDLNKYQNIIDNSKDIYY